MANFQILSCDGGGIRGVLTAVLLNRLLTAYPALLQMSRHDHYVRRHLNQPEIIALGLASGMTPASMRDLYVTDGKLMFDSSWARDVVEIGPDFSGAKYNNEELEDILKKTFGASKLQDLKWRPDRIVQPRQPVDRRKQTHLESKVLPQFSGHRQRRRFQVYDVALSTSAAPTFFPSNGVYIDGGVIANNPSLAAVAQAPMGAINPPNGRRRSVRSSCCR